MTVDKMINIIIIITTITRRTIIPTIIMNKVFIQIEQEVGTEVLIKEEEVVVDIIILMINQ